MKILHIVWAPKVGGAELFALRLAKEQALTEDITILYLGAREEDLNGEWRELDKIVCCGFNNAYDLAGYWFLFRHLRKQGYQVIHLHQSPAVLPVLSLGSSESLIVKHEHGRSSIEARSRRQRFLGRIYKDCVDLFIANSQYTRREISESEGISEEKIEVVTGGVDIDRFSAGCNSPSVEVSGVPTVLFLGRLVWEKGIEDYISVARIVHRSRPEVRFLIVGDGPLRESVESQVEQVGLVGTVSLLGFRKDIPEIMASSSIYLMTSRKEAQGLTVLEAMAAGLPTISFDAGGLPEVLGDAGILIENRSISEMASKVSCLLDDEDMRTRYRALGLSHCKDYSYPAVSAKVLNLYSERLDQ